MNILLTYYCGFIGYSVAQNLLNQKNIYLVGIDNRNHYQSIKKYLKLRASKT